MEQYHILYKTTNIINNKIYIGVHSTDNLDDDYYGSGTLITRAIRKYGKDSFSREILAIFQTKDEMYLAEAAYVNDEFVKNRNTYNAITGGRGSRKDEHMSEDARNNISHRMKINNPMNNAEIREKVSATLKARNFKMTEEERLRRVEYATANNPMHIAEVAERFKGDNNPSKQQWVKDKISDSLTGRLKDKPWYCEYCDRYFTTRWFEKHICKKIK